MPSARFGARSAAGSDILAREKLLERMRTGVSALQPRAESTPVGAKWFRPDMNRLGLRAEGSGGLVKNLRLNVPANNNFALAA